MTKSAEWCAVPEEGYEWKDQSDDDKMMGIFHFIRNEGILGFHVREQIEFELFRFKRHFIGGSDNSKNIDNWDNEKVGNWISKYSKRY